VSLLQANSRISLYKDVHFRTATDGGGSMQQQVFREKNLSLNSVQGCTLFNSGKDCRGGEAVPEEWSREAEPRKLLINSAVEQNIHFGDY